jgi:hypothetical protein
MKDIKIEEEVQKLEKLMEKQKHQEKCLRATDVQNWIDEARGCLEDAESALKNLEFSLHLEEENRRELKKNE